MPKGNDHPRPCGPVTHRQKNRGNARAQGAAAAIWAFKIVCVRAQRFGTERIMESYLRGVHHRSSEWPRITRVVHLWNAGTEVRNDKLSRIDKYTKFIINKILNINSSWEVKYPQGDPLPGVFSNLLWEHWADCPFSVTGANNRMSPVPAILSPFITRLRSDLLLIQIDAQVN